MTVKERQRHASERYASALLDVANKEGVCDVIVPALRFVREAVETEPTLAAIVASTALGRDEKLVWVQKLFIPRVHPLMADFLTLLAQRDRLALVPAIEHAVIRLLRERVGLVDVKVSSAVGLSDPLERDIERTLMAILDRPVDLHCEVDASIIGGLEVRIGDRIYDKTLRRALEQLRKRMDQRGVREVQSGRDFVGN